MSKLDQVLALLEKMDDKFTKRFNAVDQRFEAIDQRFEAIDQHFEAIDEELSRLNHKVRGLGLEFEQFRSEQQVQKEVLLELRHQRLDERLGAMEQRRV